MLKNDNYEKGWKDLDYLRFLKYSEHDELCKNYVISKKEAKNFLFLVDIFIKLAKVNVFLFCAFDICIHLRVIYYSYSIVPLEWMIISYIPNAISFYICIFLCYQHANCVFLMYFFSCIFSYKCIKSSCNRVLLNQFVNNNDINDMAKLNIKVFKDVLKIFNGNQKFIDLQFTPYYTVMLVIW